MAVGASAAAPEVAALTIEGDHFTVGDPIKIILTVTHPSEEQVTVPDLASPWGTFVIVSQSAPKTVKNVNGTASTSVLIDARMFAPGTFTTPALAVDVEDARGRTRQVVAAPATLEIASVLVEGDTEVRDLKSQAEISPWPYWTRVAGMSIVIPFFAVSLLLVSRRFRNRVPVRRPPHITAVEELDRIKDLCLPDKGYFKEHYTLVSNCMRTYMEQAFELSVWEHTTGEIHAFLEQKDLAPEVSDAMIDLLYASDIIKFSEIEPDARSANSMVTAAQWLVQMTKPSKEDANAVDTIPELTATFYEQSSSQNGRHARVVS